VEESIKAGRLGCPHALHQGACDRRGFLQLGRRKARLLDALGRNFLFLWAVGELDLAAIDADGAGRRLS
jgi:hypothetical protein